MQIDNRLLDDLARVAGGAFGTFNEVRLEIEGLLRHRLERMLADMELVPRDEFDAVKAMAEKARLEQEALEIRVSALEAALAAGAKSPPAKSAAPRARAAAAKSKSAKSES